ncbi:MAG: class I SAM-dependent methyltransferase [Cyanobacteria bacterium DS2.3.42]|nr:class I SAM-dependent methyltransferase [Cyanobacteria bacterium DS2.3.42]
MSDAATKGQFQYQGKLVGIIERVSDNMRRKMFDRFMQELQPSGSTTIIDVGVTDDQRLDSNFFERLYPHKSQLTAVGMEDAKFLETQYPGVKFVLADGLKLPFEDKSFDLAVSFAVIEHVGSNERQRAFIKELCRVGKRVCLTMPNRWYPIEFHTILPFLHWLPPEMFRSILRMIGKPFFSKEENLNLLGEKDLLELVEPGMKTKLIPFHFLMMGVSNYMLIIE